MKKAWLGRFLSILALLAAAPVWGGDSETRVNKGSGPALNTEIEAGTGDVLYSEYERSEYEHAKLKSDIRVSQSGKVLPKGLVLAAQPKVVSNRKEYCSGFETALYCLEDSDLNGSFDKVRIGGGGRALPNVSGGYILEYEPVDDLPGWRKDLLYQGASGGVARFTFHEYGTDWTTPKVTQELSYDLSTAAVACSSSVTSHRFRPRRLAQQAERSKDFRSQHRRHGSGGQPSRAGFAK